MTSAALNHLRSLYHSTTMKWLSRGESAKEAAAPNFVTCQDPGQVQGPRVRATWVGIIRAANLRVRLFHWDREAKCDRTVRRPDANWRRPTRRVAMCAVSRMHWPRRLYGEVRNVSSIFRVPVTRRMARSRESISKVTLKSKSKSFFNSETELLQKFESFDL